MKKLAKLGNSFAIPIDRKTLADAKLDESAKFDVQILPSGGLLIQSVEDIDWENLKERQNKIYNKYKNLFKRLADS